MSGDLQSLLEHAEVAAYDRNMGARQRPIAGAGLRVAARSEVAEYSNFGFQLLGLALPASHPSYGWATQWAQFLSIARRSFWSIVRNRYFFAIVSGFVYRGTEISELVALLILRSAWSLLKNSLHILLEGTPANIDIEALRRHLLERVEGHNLESTKV